MKKVFIILILAIVILGVGIFIWNTYFSKPNSQNNYEAERTSTEDKSDENTTTEEAPPPAPTTATEEGIGFYSTKIYNPDPARQNNIGITCTKLNDTVVTNGSTFSFCNTVGPSTSAEGYQQADIFDANGKMKKGLGGGNCQISTTLYNAVLNTPGLEVTERHKHSNYVPYIQSGLDAAVAYGSYDLKFVNQTGFDVKIKATPTPASVDITLLKLIYS